MESNLEKDSLEYSTITVIQSVYHLVILLLTSSEFQLLIFDFLKIFKDTIVNNDFFLFYLKFFRIKRHQKYFQHLNQKKYL